MNTKKALLAASYIHWEEVLLNPFTAGTSSDACPLCQEYLGKDDSCTSCPVAEYTGHKLCIGTPWTAANMEIEAVQDRNKPLNPEPVQNEINFLLGLYYEFQLDFPEISEYEEICGACIGPQKLRLNGVRPDKYLFLCSDQNEPQEIIRAPSYEAAQEMAEGLRVEPLTENLVREYNIWLHVRPLTGESK